MNYDFNDILCVIPARGGSKGIVDKNIQLIAGIPLVEHSIQHALDVGLNPEHIFVSSDSREVLSVARRNEVVAHERPFSLSGDSSSTEDTLLYALHYAGDRFECNHVLLLQPTSPIRLKGMLNRFIEFYTKERTGLEPYDSALTVTKFYDFFWKIAPKKSFAVSSYNPLNRPRRQDISPYAFQFFDNGNAYLTSVECLQENRCRLGKKVGIFTISELEGMQIDTPEDLEIFRDVFDGLLVNGQ